MAQRVSQIPVEVSGLTTNTPNQRVSQIPVEVSGTPTTTPNQLVSQIVVEVSAAYGRIYIDGTRFNNVNTFPAGGQVGSLGIPVVQAATWNNTNTFPAGGSLMVMTPLVVTQAALFTNTNDFNIRPDTIDPPPLVALVPGTLPVTPGTGGGGSTGGGTSPGTGPGDGGGDAGGDAGGDSGGDGGDGTSVVGGGSGGVLGAGTGIVAPSLVVQLFDRKQKQPFPREDNEYDAILQQQAEVMKAAFYPDRGPSIVQTMNGLEGLGEVDRPRGIPLIQSSGVPGPDSIYVSARQFFERGTILTPFPIDGDVEVLRFRVPTGYWGKILGLYLHYTGLNFVPGSGDIIWRVQIGRRWMRGYGNILVNLGSFANTAPLSEWEGLRSQRTVRVLVNVPNLSGLIQCGASRILAGVQGWFYSNEEVSNGRGGTIQ